LILYTHLHLPNLIDFIVSVRARGGKSAVSARWA
jgi:hypothetical protein